MRKRLQIKKINKENMGKSKCFHEFKFSQSHVTHSSHNSTYVLLIFSFLFETFPDALTIS